MLTVPHRRIHISRATLDCLDGNFKTEDGRGRERNEFLRKYNIDTFLICPREEDVGDEEPAKAQRPSSKAWSAELPFSTIIDMNSVSSCP